MKAVLEQLLTSGTQSENVHLVLGSLAQWSSSFYIPATLSLQLKHCDPIGVLSNKAKKQ